MRTTLALDTLSTSYGGKCLIQVLCPEGARMVPAQPKVNFLGFPKFLCPSCHKNVTHPLATARLVIYGLIAVLAIGWSIKIAIDGAIPGLMLAAVIMDFGARSQMAKARQRHQQTPP